MSRAVHEVRIEAGGPAVARIIVITEGRRTSIDLDAGWPICSINGKRRPIDDLTYRWQPVSIQDAIETLVEACAREASKPHEKVLVGRCPICGHYGTDCEGTL